MTENGLKRTLGLFPATNIVIANMIGAGIFTTSGLLMADLGSPFLLIALWAVGGIIALCGALSYGELGANFPEAGGEYMFLSRIFHPSLGFLSGWVSFIVGFSAPIAASALGFSEYFIRAFPELSHWISDNTFLGITGVSKLFAVTVVLVFTLVHLRGIEFGSRIQNWLTILKVLLVTGLIVAGIAFGRGDMDNFKAKSTLGEGIAGWKTMGLAIMWIMFAYSGWNASTYIGSEVKKPKRNLPGSLIIGTSAVIILYLLLNAVFVYAMPSDEMKGVISVGGLAMGKLFGPEAETIFSLLISFALFSSLSAFIIIGPRVYYSMARDGLFFKFAARTSRRYSVPLHSLYLQSAIAIIFILSGTFDQILTYMGFSLGIFPLLTIAGSFKIRKTKMIHSRIPGFPLPQLIYLSAGSLILVLAFLERPLESSIALLTVAAGIPAYLVFSSRRSSNR
ncbi:MAG: amino acid permease [Spirochaetales bacterium]|jgi:APA family basic amino acid/polyamine antiporter|nr:amino acid permease [Spirochaetales bacterium]